MATIADVARRAGVSIATVSRVLSPGAQPHPVSERTARRVRDAATELDFVPSALAKGLASRRSGLLGLVVPDLADPHYPQIARGAEERAQAADLAVLVCNTHGDPGRLREYLRLLRARRVDALVVSGGGSLGADELAAIQGSGLPAVLIGRPAREVATPFVAVGNCQAARVATAHLADLGRKRIVHLAGPPGHTTMADRAAGYREEMRARGWRPKVIFTDGTADAASKAIAELLAAGSPAPQAVFAATDRLAVAAIAAAMDKGLDVPHDLAVVGFDDIPLAAFLRPSLSSVAQPAQLLGETAVHQALAQVDGHVPAPVVLAAQLVVRASSGVP